MKKGRSILVETKTMNDLFGKVLYYIEEVGLETKDGVNDGVRLVMKGGTGGSARAGMVITDTVRELTRLISENKAQFVNEEKAKAYEAKYNNESETNVVTGGIIELE